MEGLEITLLKSEYYSIALVTQCKTKDTKIKIMFSFLVNFVKINFFRDKSLVHYSLVSESMIKELKYSVLYQEAII